MLVLKDVGIMSVNDRHCHPVANCSLHVRDAPLPYLVVDATFRLAGSEVGARLDNTFGD